MTLIRSLFAAALLAAGPAGPAGAADLTILVDDLKQADGNIEVSLFNSAGTFMRSAVATRSAPTSAAANTVVLKDLQPGEYAFAVFHDVNSNGKLDKNLLGIPTEDYAFSNNALGKMGPPSFEQARFTLPAAGATLRVSFR